MDSSHPVLSGGSMVSRPISYRSVPSGEIELTNYTGNDEIALVDSHIHVQRHNSRRLRPGTDTHPWITQTTLKNIISRPGLAHFLLNLLSISIILGLLVLIGFMSFSNSIFDGSEVCKPDGTFELTFDSYTPWSQDAVFAINLGFGSYSFGIAKLIDIIWDVAVGRGGQALLALATYKVFTETLTYLMESSAVSTSAFEAVTLQNDTVTGISKLMRHFWQTSNARAMRSMFCIILSSLFVIALPTWLSAMTGYTADITAFVQDVNNNLIPAEDFHPSIYTIHDGSRLGYPYADDFRVIVPWINGTGVSLGISEYGCDRTYKVVYTNSSYTSWTLTRTDDASENCTLLWLVSRYTSVYGFLGQNDTESVFEFPNRTNLTIPKPSLDISAHMATRAKDNSISVDDITAKYGYSSSSWYYIPYGHYWISGVTHDAPFVNSNPMFYYANSGTAYNLSQINDRGTCQQPHQVRYKWGFSYVLLYAFLITWLVWAIVMYNLYLTSYYNSRLNAVKRQIGLKRAVLDLSASMRKHLREEDTLLDSDSQLCSLVKGDLISYQNIMLDTLPPPRMENATIVLWFRREKWWLAALCVFSLFLTLSWLNSIFSRGWSYLFSTMPVVGVLIVLTLARKRRRRWLHFAFWFLFFWIGNIWWIVQVARWRD